MSEPTIPVQIDSIKRLKGFQRARCVYFRIEASDMPITGSFPVLPRGHALLAAWGSWAVLAGPGKSIDAHGLFRTPESIRRTLQGIEEIEQVFLDLGHIWLPNELLSVQQEGARIMTGDVYRLSLPLFSQCYRFVAEMITEQEWLASCKSYSQAIRPSPKETAAFRLWRREQIERSKARYYHPDYAARQLPKKQGTKQ
jgi:hypothetical protein